MANHYIRLDTSNNIIKGFSDDFETPLETDICINNNAGRHFEINNEVNPSLITVQGLYKYKYIGKNIIEKSQTEINAEIELIPKCPPDKSDKLRADVDYLLMLQGERI